MTRTILISLCILLGVQYGCKTGKSRVAQDDNKRIESRADTTKGVISPPLTTSRKVDTLLFQVADLSATIVGQRNLLGQRQGNMEVKIPVRLKNGNPNLKDSLIAFAYWIGVGEPDISAYTALTEEVPPEWSQPGVSAPLAAYWLGYPVVLPGPADSLVSQRSVRFDFVDSGGRTAFAQQKSYTSPISRDPEHPNFGIVSGAQLQGLYDTRSQDPEQGEGTLRFHFAFANQHEINSYQVQLKVVGVYEVEQ